MQINLNRSESIKTIIAAGGRLILLKDFPAADRRAKEPIDGVPWKRYKPTLDVLMAHPGRLGLVPASIHSTALDVDRGDPHSLPISWVEYPSRRPGGKHLWYAETQQFKDCAWEAAGCSGEIRSKGYLIPWNGGIQRIAGAILDGRQMSLFPFPVDLIKELVQERGSELYIPGREKRSAPVPRSLWYPGMELERVQVGARYVALFEHLRKWAYRQRRGTDLADWKARVLDECFAKNERFPKPFRGDEVRQVKDTAYSVSCWAWKTLLDYGRYRTPALQSKRGSASGASRHEATALRNKAIIQALQGGAAVNEQAILYGLTERTIFRIKREYL